VVALTAATAACGSPSPDAAGGGGSPVATGTPTTEAARDITADGPRPTLAVEVDDNYFDPAAVTAAPGAVVTVSLENEGSRTHTFTVTGGPDQTLAPGQKANVQVTLPASGTVPFSCRFHAGGGMKGSFSVGGATTATTAAAGGAGASGY
jgi:plastocyanin